MSFAPPLDEKLATFLSTLPSVSLTERLAMDVNEVRLREEMLAKAAGRGPPLARVIDIEIEGPGGALALRLYSSSEPQCEEACCLYFHGGGGVIGSLTTHDALCRRLALLFDGTILSVNYRLAPEHPFPAALDDCAATVDWLQTNGAAFGIAFNRLAFAGDSIGAALAVSLALELPDQLRPRALSLAYGMFSVEPAIVSAEHGGLEGELLEWFLSRYLSSSISQGDPRAFPLHALLHNLPPTQLIVAECDSLRRGNMAFARQLKAVGALADLTVWPGTTHGFLTAPEHVPSAQEACRRMTKFLNHFLCHKTA